MAAGLEAHETRMLYGRDGSLGLWSHRLARRMELDQGLLSGGARLLQPDPASPCGRHLEGRAGILQEKPVRVAKGLSYDGQFH